VTLLRNQVLIRLVMMMTPLLVVTLGMVTTVVTVVTVLMWCRFEAPDAYRNVRMYRQEIDAVFREFYNDVEKQFRKYTGGR
jgi:hypothetical protein